MHNQEEYQTVVDKKLITNLEREIEFLKSKISIKNEIIKKLLNNDSRQNKNCNMVGETWDFDVTHETSDSESSISNSEYSIVKSRDVNTLNTKSSGISNDDQPKIIRKEKHQEHLLNTGCKSPCSENAKNNKNTKQFSDQQAKKENINEVEETNKEFHWPSGTCAIIGDSMVNGIDEKKLQKHGNVKVFYFPGARINDTNHHLMPIIAKQPDYLILHVGTNDAITNTSRKLIDDLLMLKSNILKQLSNCRVIVSKPTIRIDHRKANLTPRNVGVNIEGRLNCDYHVNTLLKKASKKCHALARVCNYMDTKKRRVLMKAFITSQFSCLDVFFQFSCLNRINKIHERALRLVYKNETFLSFDDLLKRDRSVSIHQKNLQILATEIYKTKNDLRPKIMKDTFHFIQKTYNLRNDPEL